MAVWQALTEEGTTYTVNKTFQAMTPKERADIERFQARAPDQAMPAASPEGPPAGPNPDNTLTPGARGGQPITPAGGSGSPGDQSVPPQVRGGQSITPSSGTRPGGNVAGGGGGSGAPPPTADINDPNKPFNAFDPSLDNAFGNTPVGPPTPAGAPRTPNEADVNKLPPGVLKAMARPGPDPVPGSNAPGDKWWPDPSSALYDQYVINKLLQDYGMNNWTGADRAPVEIMKEGKNEYGEATGQMVGTGQFIINVRDPVGGEVRALKLAKLKNADPNSKAYGWGLLESAITVAAKDAKLLGHSGLMTIGGTVYGTNNTTGAFEPVPGAPKVVQNWGQPYQIDDGKGNKVWYGTDPADGTPKPIPGMPSSPSVAGFDNPQWVERGGKLVYVGWNQKTGKIEDVPGMTPQPLPDKPLVTSPSGSNIYVKGPDGNFILAPGVSQPTVGMERKIPDPANPGYHKKQIFNQAGEWEDQVGAPDFLTPTGILAKATRPKGEKYWIVYPGSTDRQIEVESDGAGGYTMPENPRVRRISGLADSVATTTGTDEFLQRWNPESQTYEQFKNPNWQPKGTGDQVRQLREQAEAKRKELHDKIGKNGYTSDQAEADFNTFWDSQILPRQQQIEFDQRKEIEDRDRLNQTQRAANLTSAAAVGTTMGNFANLYNQQSVSPTFGNYVQQFTKDTGAGKVTEINPQDFMKPTYDLQEVAQYYTAQALKGISPTADAIGGGLGMPGALQSSARGVDVGAALGQRSFTLPGGGGPAQSSGGGTTITINTAAPGGAPEAAAAGGVTAAPGAATAPGVSLGTFPTGQAWDPNKALGGYQWQ